MTILLLLINPVDSYVKINTLFLNYAYILYIILYFIDNDNKYSNRHALKKQKCSL